LKNIWDAISYGVDTQHGWYDETSGKRSKTLPRGEAKHRKHPPVIHSEPINLEEPWNGTKAVLLDRLSDEALDAL
jgi:hypothetical protein